jgi:hypothetical protein
MNFVRLSNSFSAPRQRQRKALNMIVREYLNGEMSQELQPVTLHGPKHHLRGSVPSPDGQVIRGPS